MSRKSKDELIHDHNHEGVEGQKLQGVLLMHLVFGAAASLLLWIVCLIHYAERKNDTALPAYRVLIEAVAVVVVVLTGHVGGVLSGVKLGT